MGDGPIFIVGCGRSGTSLLRRFMNQHSRVGIPLESLFMVDYLQAATRIPVEQMTGMLVREPEVKEWGLRPVQRDLAGSGTIADAIDCLHQLYLARRGKSRWGQKTPRFVRHLPLLRSHFPGARFVHLVRDPRAVAASLIRSNVHRSTAYYAARRWRMDVDFGLAFEQIEPESVLRVSYEALVAGPEGVVRNVCEFCDLEFEPKMLASPEGRGSEYSDFYAQIHSNVDRPPTVDSVDRWAKDLNDNEIALIETLAGGRMDELGYARLSQEQAILPSAWKIRGDRLRGMAEQAYRYARYRPRYLAFVLYRKARLGLLKSFLWSVNY